MENKNKIKTKYIKMFIQGKQSMMDVCKLFHSINHIIALVCSRNSIFLYLKVVSINPSSNTSENFSKRYLI